MVRGVVVVVVVGLSETANADDSALASSHAQRSATLYLSSGWSPSPMVPVRVSAEGALRFHRGYLAVETRLGLGGAASLTALGSQLQGHAGASIGAALPAGKRIVFAPMLAYDVFGLWEKYGATVAIHYVTVEVPIAIVFDRVVIEPYVQLGIARFQGATDPVIVVGPRIGLVL